MIERRPLGTNRRSGLRAVPRGDELRRTGRRGDVREAAAHRARRRHQLRRHRGRLHRRRERTDRRRGARRERPARRHRAGDEGRHAVRARSRTSGAHRGGTSSRSCEASLRRLRTDHIDLYQLHRPSFDIDPEETLRGLRRPRARRQGREHRLLDPSGVVRGRVPRGERPAGLGSLHQRAAAVQPARPHGSRTSSSRWRCGTASRCCRGRRWPAASSPVATSRPASRRRAHEPSGWPACASASPRRRSPPRTRSASSPTSAT